MGAFFVGHCGWSTRLVCWEKGAGHYNLKLSLIPGCGNKVPRCCGIVFSWSNARSHRGQIVAIFGPAPLLCELACRR